MFNCTKMHLAASTYTKLGLWLSTGSAATRVRKLDISTRRETIMRCLQVTNSLRDTPLERSAANLQKHGVKLVKLGDVLRRQRLQKEKAGRKRGARSVTEE